jgi:hypothetical protein
VREAENLAAACAHIVAVLELSSLFGERVVGEVHVGVFCILRRGRLVHVDGEAREALAEEEDAHGRVLLRGVLHVRNQHVQPQVELETVNEHRPANVLLHHALSAGRPALALRLGGEADAVATRANVGFDDIVRPRLPMPVRRRRCRLDVLAHRVLLLRQ